MTESTQQRKNKNLRSRSSKRSTSEGPSENQGKLSQEIEKAMKAVKSTMIMTSKLHESWRNHLLRLSYLVALLTLHQFQQPFGECITNVKSHNDIVQNEEKVSGWNTVWLATNATMCEIVNVVISLCLVSFLSLKDPNAELKTWQYIISSSLVPLCLGIYFHTKRIECIGEELLVNDSDDKTTRQFPVAVIFHTIVTGSLWFMKMAMEKCKNNVESVEKLQKNLESLSKK
mmetsp:Transcript_17738/g.25032  ORF Transcript_17738/g.25032 Transcript_17738/m.25032 type:complete len:230 (-) Transcript_17738:465-1154(-)